jgi:hypothetical protein
MNSGFRKGSAWDAQKQRIDQHDRNPTEMTMSSILNSRTLFAGAVTALFFGLSMSGAAQASTTSKLLQCKAGSRGAAVSCCQEIVRTHGAPAWLGGRDNCNRAISCGSWNSNYSCFITTTYQPPYLKNNSPGGSGGSTSTSSIPNKP